MNREGHNDAVMFIGTEVEHTPTYGMKTLFVVGIVPIKLILEEALRHDVEQVYIGANHTFLEYDGPKRWWTDMIEACLQEDYWVTLELNTDQLADLQSRFTRIVEHNKFIPMISVSLPNIKKLNYNAVLKLDDKDFNATNPGVWVHSIHNLQKRSVFTDWSKYTQDQVLDVEIPKDE